MTEHRAVTPYGVDRLDYHVEVMDSETWRWHRVGPDWPTAERAAQYGRDVVEPDADGGWRTVDSDGNVVDLYG